MQDKQSFWYVIFLHQNKMRKTWYMFRKPLFNFDQFFSTSDKSQKFQNSSSVRCYIIICIPISMKRKRVETWINYNLIHGLIHPTSYMTIAWTKCSYHSWMNSNLDGILSKWKVQFFFLLSFCLQRCLHIKPQVCY